MKVKRFLLVCVINAFLMCFVTILYEYINLADRFTDIEQVVNTSVESAVDASMGAEELFTSQNKQSGKESSVGESQGKSTNNSILVISKSGKLYNMNLYAYSYYFNKAIRDNISAFNNNDTVLNQVANYNYSTQFFYSYIYGAVGSAWCSEKQKNALLWTGTSKSTRDLYQDEYNKMNKTIRLNFNGNAAADEDIITAETSHSRAYREPASDFKKFYDSVGWYIKSKVTVRKKVGNTFELVTKKIPVLTNMGLNLNNYNRAGSRFTMQNYLSVMKIGKNVSNDSVTYSRYYLTPYSLGVTYIPAKVFYPTLLNTLNNTVAFRKLSGGSKNTDLSELKSHYGCIKENSTYTHRDTRGGQLIVNDGQVEYDLRATNFRIDYITTDFADWETNATKQQLIRQIEGSIATAHNNKEYSDSELARESAEAILGPQFSSDESKPTRRIIARITVQVKVHVPYQSMLMKAACNLSGRYTGKTRSYEHYDISDYDSSTGTSTHGDGVWYEYVTYRCHSR